MRAEEYKHLKQEIADTIGRLRGLIRLMKTHEKLNKIRERQAQNDLDMLEVEFLSLLQRVRDIDINDIDTHNPI